MKTLLAEICRSILRPLASVLLRCGLTWKEFADISKAAFVEVATGEFGKRGRPTSISRVCILTGIHRKEVKRLRDLISVAPSRLTEKTGDATRLLNGWHLDPEYQDSEKHPLVLPLAGPSPSFSSLFSRYGGDTPEQTMLRELKDSEAITVSADGLATVHKRYFMPQALSDESVQVFGTHITQLAETLRNNIVEHSRSRPRFEGSAIEHNIHPDALAEFHQFVEARSQSLLEDVDDWLAQHQISTEDEDTRPVTLGLGIYAIESQDTLR